MHTARSLTVSPYLVVSTHAPPPGSNHACSPPEHPRTPPLEQPRTPPRNNHACPPRSNHAPPSPWATTHTPPGATTHAPPSNHARPPVDRMWTHASENITLPQLRWRAVTMKAKQLLYWSAFDLYYTWNRKCTLHFIIELNQKYNLNYPAGPFLLFHQILLLTRTHFHAKLTCAHSNATKVLVWVLLS